MHHQHHHGGGGGGGNSSAAAPPSSGNNNNVTNNPSHSSQPPYHQQHSQPQKYPHPYSSPSSHHKNGATTPSQLYQQPPTSHQHQQNSFLLHGGGGPPSHLPRIDLGPGSLAVQHPRLPDKGPPGPGPAAGHPMPNYWPPPSMTRNNVPLPAPISLTQAGSISYRTIEGERNSAEISKRQIQAEVMKHFEQSFKMAEKRDSGQRNSVLDFGVGPRGGQPPGPGFGSPKSRGPMVLPPESYAQPQSYPLLSSSPSAQRPSSSIHPDLNSGPPQPRSQPQFPPPNPFATHTHHVPPPLVANSGGGAARTIKVSSPAPAQIYGKPVITQLKSENNNGSSTSSGRDSPMELTSRVPSTPPRTSIPNNMFSIAKFQNQENNDGPYDLSRPNNPEIQSEPLFLKREPTEPLLGGIDKRPRIDPPPMHNYSDTTMDLSCTSRNYETLQQQPQLKLPIIQKNENEECVDMSTNSKETVPVLEMKLCETEETSLNLSTNTTKPVVVVAEIPDQLIEKEDKEETKEINEEIPAQSALEANQSNLPIHKGKKAWLQRHSGQETTTTNVPSPNEPDPDPSIPIDESLNGNSRLRRRKTRNELDSIKGNGDMDHPTGFSNSSTESENEGKSTKRKRGQRRSRNQSFSIGGGSNNSATNNSEESDALHQSNASSCKSSPSKRGGPKQSSTQKKREKKNTSESLGTPTRKTNPFNRPSLLVLKRSGDTFLQDGSCIEIAPKLMKCRECKAQNISTVKDDEDGVTHIFCRFYGFRKLKYAKSGLIKHDGFSDAMGDPKQEDLNLWLPNPKVLPKNLDGTLAKFIIEQLGDQFCELIQQEQGAIEIHKQAEIKPESDNSGEEEQSSTPIAWKRVVQGVREMCDVCDTTLFNYHWACGKCGFVVCIDCVKAKVNRKEKDTPKTRDSSSGCRSDRDSFNWLYCSIYKQNKQIHEIDKLMLTQTIPKDALLTLGKLMHFIRTKYNIPQKCKCTFNAQEFVGSDEFNKLMNQGTEIEQDKDKTVPELEPKVEGNLKEPLGVESISDNSQNVTNNQVQETNSSALPNEEDISLNGNQPVSSLDPETELIASNGKVPIEPEPEPITTPVNDDNSTKREPGETPNSGTNILPTSNKHKKVLIDSDSSEDENDPLRSLFQKAKPLKPIQSSGKIIQKPIQKAPHTYLCGGKLLHLFDPHSEGNFLLFSQVWKHGHPVLVSNVASNLDSNLWSPESFLEDFGEYKNDLINCLTGKIVADQPMSRFWNGFFRMSDRLKDAEGKPMLLKLKDWPPGEDFAESLPSRFINLMDHLPLPEYTRRDGRLNLASLLPDKFVKPDLGPKMYIAYGSAFHLNKATTNLHLDISDAVNLMVYVGMCEDISPEDKAEHENALKEALDYSDCDGFTLDRLKESNRQPGALWHIYNAKDADKIRDFLNRVNVENGKAPAPNHDPIHDQVWYLDRDLRRRLIDEYNVVGYPIIQFMGDAVFIPAGAPHQVRNLQNCIKVAEDFVSPEHVRHCFELTQEFRGLSDTHSNHEDKLQIKNIIYHAVKDAVTVLNLNMKNETPKKS